MAKLRRLPPLTRWPTVFWHGARASYPSTTCCTKQLRLAAFPQPHWQAWMSRDIGALWNEGCARGWTALEETPGAVSPIALRAAAPPACPFAQHDKGETTAPAAGSQPILRDRA